MTQHAQGSSVARVYESYRALRMGGATERCHGVRHTGSYSVGAHSWGVAALMWLLFPDDFPRLAAYVMAHDVPEAWTGDAPAPVKHWRPEVRAAYDEIERSVCDRFGLPCVADLSAEDREILKICDLLELYTWVLEEMAAGNTHARGVRGELDVYLAERSLPPHVEVFLRTLRARGMVHQHSSVVRSTRRAAE